MKFRKDGENMAIGRVIGFGSEIESVMTRLKSSYDPTDVICHMAEEKDVTPKEEQVVILLVTEMSSLIKNVALSYYQSRILTLIISTCTNEYRGPWDAMTVVPPDTVESCVNAILNAVLSDGFVTTELTDIAVTLKDVGFFQIEEKSNHLEDGRVSDVVLELADLLDYDFFKSAEKILVILYINYHIIPLITMDRFQSLFELLKNRANDSDLVVTLLYDQNMPTDMVRLCTVVARRFDS